MLWDPFSGTRVRAWGFLKEVGAAEETGGLTGEAKFLLKTAIQAEAWESLTEAAPRCPC